AAFSFAGTFVVLKIVGAFASLRAPVREEGLGLDVTQHGEEAYARVDGAILVLNDPQSPATPLGAPILEPGQGAV
ncbi:MAG TPA: hypothetical protein VF376_07480, partial [Thermoanaerobaculia bacterium]